MSYLVQRHWSNNNIRSIPLACNTLVERLRNFTDRSYADRSHCVPRMAGENARAHGVRREADNSAIRGERDEAETRLLRSR